MPITNCSIGRRKQCKDNPLKCFEILLGGLGHIDIDDWKSHTRLKHCNPETQVVKWFWEILDEYSEEMRARLLQFVTGSSRVKKLFRSFVIRFGQKILFCSNQFSLNDKKLLAFGTSFVGDHSQKHFPILVDGRLKGLKYVCLKHK